MIIKAKPASTKDLVGEAPPKKSQEPVFKTRNEVYQWLNANRDKMLVDAEGRVYRWDAEEGPVARRHSRDVWWDAEVNGPASQYKIAFIPRRFGPWVEVQEWKDADEGGIQQEADGFRRMELKATVYVFKGHWNLTSVPGGVIGTQTAGEYVYVRRAKEGE